MKRFIIGTAICLLCLSCGRNSFEINGTTTEPDGTEIYLIDLRDSDTLGVTTVERNTFAFSGTVEEPIYAYVGHGKQRVRFILENGQVTVDLDKRIESGTPMTDAYNAFHKRYYGLDKSLKEERRNLVDSIVSLNKDNLLGVMALDDLAYSDTLGFMELYGTMSEKMQEYPLIKDDFENIKQQARTAPGKKFKDYLVKGGNPDGTDVRLSDYVGRGKYILVDHWASWCGPCKAEMPYIRKVWEAFSGEKFDVVGVALNDKREDTLEALSKLGLPWHQILDAQRIPIELYNINAIPHIILFGPDGEILERGLRGGQIYETVAKYLNQ